MALAHRLRLGRGCLHRSCPLPIVLIERPNQSATRLPVGATVAQRTGLTAGRWRLIVPDPLAPVGGAERQDEIIGVAIDMGLTLEREVLLAKEPTGAVVLWQRGGGPDNALLERYQVLARAIFAVCHSTANV